MDNELTDVLTVGMAKGKFLTIEAVLHGEPVGWLKLAIDSKYMEGGALYVLDVKVTEGFRLRYIATKMYEYMHKHFSEYRISGDVERDGVGFHKLKSGKPEHVVHIERNFAERYKVGFKDFPNPEPEEFDIPKQAKKKNVLKKKSVLKNNDASRLGSQ